MIDDAIVVRFLDVACPDHHVRGGNDHVRVKWTAMRLLDRYPEIARANLYTAIVCGEMDVVREIITRQPELVNATNGREDPVRGDSGGDGDLIGPKTFGPAGLTPLLYACFARLPRAQTTDNAVDIARLLIEHGAITTAFFRAGGSSYTPLVGAIGEGEEGRPAHPRRNELVKLLLDNGADPYDNQVIYNIHFKADVLWFMELSYARSLELGRKADWDDPDWSMLNMGGYGTGARWHLEMAIKNRDVALARWCLEHGASPNPLPARDTRFSQASLYDGAMRLGETEIAALLVQFGAPRTHAIVPPEAAFVQRCLSMDQVAVAQQVALHPEYLTSTAAMFAAAEHDRDDVIRLLLDLGTPVEVENESKERTIHRASYANAVRVVKLLIERGADTNTVETHWGNTPLDAAMWSSAEEVIALLTPHSTSVWGLATTGNVNGMRRLLSEHPERARVSWEGHTPLMWLVADDESRALKIVELLLANGADPSLKNQEGMSAADRAERQAMFDVAARLRLAEAAQAPT